MSKQENRRGPQSKLFSFFSSQRGGDLHLDDEQEAREHLQLHTDLQPHATLSLPRVEHRHRDLQGVWPIQLHGSRDLRLVPPGI